MHKHRNRQTGEFPGQMRQWSALREFWGRLRDPARDVEFDRTWGVTTCGRIAPQPADVVGPHWADGAEYQGCNAPALDQALRRLSIAHDQFTFLDLGCGKGRALLVAARLPFRRVVGVEYSAPLHAIAQRNLARFPRSAIQCGEVAVVRADAATFPIPDGPLALFLFNPFGKAVMAAVVNNVAAAFAEQPRRILVLYSNPVWSELWGAAPCLHRTHSPQKTLTVFDTQDSPPSPQ